MRNHSDASKGRFSSMRVKIAFIAFALTVLPASADQLKFAPGVFKIYGGMNTGDQSASIYAPQTPQPSVSARTTHQTIAFASTMEPGSILIRTAERRLYYILGDNRAIMYPVGVGREGFTWSGQNKITRKATWPDWRPPQVMINREAERGKFIPAFVPGGPENPLGARALYIGDTEYRIHGTTAPSSIGRAMSSGCIRMMNNEVIDLFNRVQIGADVVVE
jgi:lipoprotein-anchoring transpeptidase ErfK/SrfK